MSKSYIGAVLRGIIGLAVAAALTLPVRAETLADALADEGGPGPAAIGKYVAPRALLWFRMAAAATWLTGAWALSISPQYGFIKTFLLMSLNFKVCQKIIKALTYLL